MRLVGWKRQRGDIKVWREALLRFWREAEVHRITEVRLETASWRSRNAIGSWHKDFLGSVCESDITLGLVLTSNQKLHYTKNANPFYVLLY
ncbi:hypothetical protein TNCT_152611 [Trichonephila clavata]|uniref:Uncharacterized protein n=1 Tax=Trichonephila clavata TaxID=2740835 RepID=A0A8X6GM03_TRICU|nr:hypothetical protein TNCT_152611 [Trichonephila clavata]